jgi:hypothetical protein
MRATNGDLLALARAGYRVELADCGMGPVPGSWVLLDPDGDCLLIGDHGMIAPTQWEAVAEGLHRLEEERRHANVG